MQPFKRSSKQRDKLQVASNYVIVMKDNSENLFNAEEIKPLALKSNLTKDIEPKYGNALDKELLLKRTPFIQALQICSVSNDSHNENSDVHDRGNVIPQNSDANLVDEQLSSCNSASTELYFSGLQTLTTEREVEVLNPLLTKRITKCDSIAISCVQNLIPDNCLTSKVMWICMETWISNS